MAFRRLWPALFLLCFALTGWAQNRYETSYSAGLILKVVQSNINFENNQVNVPESEPEIGYQLGGFLRIRINELYFQPELLLSRTQNQLMFLNFNGVQGFNPRADFEFNSIDIPMVVGYYFGNLRLETGPGISILTRGRQFFLNEETNITDDFNRVSLQYYIGAGVDINDVFINVDYQFGLSKTGESLRNIVGADFQSSRSQLVFSIAVALHRHKKR